MLQKSNPCVQRMVPTSEMEAAASTGNSVNTLPQYFQTPVTNPGNNTHNSTVIHDNIEEGFPVDHRNVGIHTATENQECEGSSINCATKWQFTPCFRKLCVTDRVS